MKISSKGFSSSLGTQAQALIVLGLGSNRGAALGRDSRFILNGAISALGEVLSGLRRASLYETEPLHIINQPRFLNTAVAGFYSGSPGELLETIHIIEAGFGRDRSREQRWGERTLDIDILLFGDRIISENSGEETDRMSALEIPHPRLCERRFALLPLVELLPDARDPRTGIPFQAILEGLPPQGRITLI
jgi:2-amino-4-hydroxy-6-hydroxymethyldihydropteridine diphosphokinase